MNSPESNRKIPLFFDPQGLGKSLKEVGVDYLKVESKEVKTRWFHGTKDVDLFLWIDAREQIIKQQLSFCGQIVEWNIVEGLKTGLVIEQELEDNKINASEIVKFDDKPIIPSVQSAIELVRYVESLEEVQRLVVIHNFSSEPKNLFEDVKFLSASGFGFSKRLLAFLKSILK